MIVKDRVNDARNIQNTIRDTLGVNLKAEDVSIIIQYHST